MRTVSVATIRETVRELCLQAGRTPDPALEGLLQHALERERSPFGQEVLRQIIQNIACAKACTLPLCQDTGMAVVFMDIGQDVHIEGGFVGDAVNEGVRIAYKEGYFRNSVLSPLSRINTGDNTPAVLHTRIVPGEGIRIAVAPKGFGSENMSRITMLTPSAGVEGVCDAIVEAVRIAGSKPCPPVVVGVGIGGTFELCAHMAKESLLRPLGQPSADPTLARLEQELLERINKLGIGPMGLGGDTTALAVHILTHETHLAGLPVAVNMQCHSVRHAEKEL